MCPCEQAREYCDRAPDGESHTFRHTHCTLQSEHEMPPDGQHKLMRQVQISIILRCGGPPMEDGGEAKFCPEIGPMTQRTGSLVV